MSAITLKQHLLTPKLNKTNLHGLSVPNNPRNFFEFAFLVGVIGKALNLFAIKNRRISYLP
jgi:hypothetical protein